MSEVIGSALSPSEAKPVVEGVNETPQEATPAPKDEFEDKFLRLTRKERALQQMQAELKSKQAEIDRMKSEYDSFIDRKSKLKENPFDALELLGVSYDDLTQALISQGQPVDKLTEIEKKLQMLEEREEKEKQAKQLEQEKALEQERQRAIEAYTDNLAKFIESSDYELVKANDAQETVFEVIQQDYLSRQQAGEKDLKLMEFDVACQKVEAFLESQLDKFLTLKKVQSKIQPKEEPKSSFPASVTQPRASGSTTLTNAMKAATEPATPQHRRPSEQELFNSAAAMIKFI